MIVINKSQHFENWKTILLLMKLSTKTETALLSMFNLLPKFNKLSKSKRCSKFEHISIEILFPLSIIDFICSITNLFNLSTFLLK